METRLVYEIDKYCCSLLKHHYPETPNLGENENYRGTTKNEQPRINLLVGGTPCQSFTPDSEADWMMIVATIRIRVCRLDCGNMPQAGSFGRMSPESCQVMPEGDFGHTRSTSTAWVNRILDAQYTRTQHPNIQDESVCSLSDILETCQAAVLLERESLCGYPAPSRFTDTTLEMDWQTTGGLVATKSDVATSVGTE